MFVCRMRVGCPTAPWPWDLAMRAGCPLAREDAIKELEALNFDEY